MLRNRMVTVLSAGVALIFLGAVLAAPPKSTTSKKKTGGTSAAEKNDAADTQAEAKGKKSDDNSEGDADEDGESKKVVKTDAEWRKILTPMQFKVARKKETEAPFGRDYNKFKKEGDGTYKCVCCGQTLFESSTKFDSGTGWPSFYQAIDEKAIQRLEDTSEGMLRTEVECSRCDAHLGHVFDDGPPPTGERFCMNYASLKFVPKGGAKKGAADKGTKGKSAKAKGSKAQDSD